ncbi:type II toxin-antitoxin system PemK/MazF family toxin [Candidatus Woesearchaeota archaeon]|nr:type II toxin-antitoxin system PemK/MazF family toxin [Candidatus Woesearchaeota archaeon]
MERFVKGDVLIVKFPFSDLTSIKKRPALVVANLTGDDYILAQITSVARVDNYSITLSNQDFKEGRLPVSSLIRPNKLFTSDKSLILYCVGLLKEKKIKEVEESLINIFKN